VLEDGRVCFGTRLGVVSEVTLATGLSIAEACLAQLTRHPEGDAATPWL